MSKEENILIAEFLGYSFNGKFWLKNNRRLYDISANFDWNFLIPIIEKISDEKHWSLNATIDWLSENYDFDGLYNIEDFYKAIVLYIKEHNESN